MEKRIEPIGRIERIAGVEKIRGYTPAERIAKVTNHHQRWWLGKRTAQSG